MNRQLNVCMFVVNVGLSCTKDYRSAFGAPIIFVYTTSDKLSGRLIDLNNLSGQVIEVSSLICLDKIIIEVDNLSVPLIAVYNLSGQLIGLDKSSTDRSIAVSKEYCRTFNSYASVYSTQLAHTG